MSSRSLGLAVILGLATFASTAGPHTDALTQCMSKNMTDADKGILARWTFVALSQNPEVASLSKVTQADIDKVGDRVGVLVLRLMTKDCRAQLAKAVQLEGGVAVRDAFQVVGSAGSSILYNNPQVLSVVAQIGDHVDFAKLKAAAE
jgi:hypothetical protein